MIRRNREGVVGKTILVDGSDVNFHMSPTPGGETFGDTMTMKSVDGMTFTLSYATD